MNKLILLLSLTLLLFSCTKKGQYTISGTVSNNALEGKPVYFSKVGDKGIEKSDTAIIKGGKFEFVGMQEEPALYYISADPSFGDELVQGIPVLVKPGKISVDVNEKVTISGNSENEAYQKMIDDQTPYLKEFQSLDQQYKKAFQDSVMTPELEANLRQKAQTAISKVAEIAANFANDNIKNPLGEVVFFKYVGLMSDVQVTTILSYADEKFKAKPQIAAMLERHDMSQKVTEGQKFIDFTLKSVDGKDISLSDYVGKGKYVLIDFWASWCKPCVNEMPTLVEAYKLYKNKNFEIVGVSLDEEKNAWVKGIKDLNITWPQVSDLKGCEVATRPYLVTSIPHTILLDPNGMIIAKDLRGEDLLNKLKTLIK